jgi:diguanylate cyclase (GGDEF)-like protein
MATDFQNLVDGMVPATSVMSVQVLEDGSCGEIRVVAGNQGYIDSIERPAGDYQMRANKFVPNSLYTDYVPRDLNFEDFCFRSAVGQKCLHSYVRPNQMPVWFNMTFMPIGPSNGNIHYCTYSMEVNFEANTKRMSNISEELSSAILETCIKLRREKDFESTMEDVIVDIRELCKAEHCCVLLTDAYERKCKVLCEAFSEETILRPMRKYSDDPTFYALTETWMDLIGSSNCVIAKNEKEMAIVKERDPEWYASLTNAGAKNIVLFPLKSKDELLGYIWAINFEADQAPKIKETLELTTFILGSEIANYLLLNRLKVLSSKDMLTGVLNRNEMNNYVDKLSEEHVKEPRSVGVAFADLNGLKIINDQGGHGAGDILLKDAAKAMEAVFPADCIYRAGGDEFTVIMLDITEAELNKRVMKLRKISQNYPNVSFAIGSSIEDDSRNVRQALKVADVRMYEDKKIFYQEHPEYRRRFL